MMLAPLWKLSREQQLFAIQDTFLEDKDIEITARSEFLQLPPVDRGRDQRVFRITADLFGNQLATMIAKIPKLATSLEDNISLISSFIGEIQKYVDCGRHPLLLDQYRLYNCWGVPMIVSAPQDVTLNALIERREIALSGTEPVRLPVCDVDCVSVAIQILHVLEYCSRRGIVSHQDLKPSNILLEIGPLAVVGGKAKVKYHVRVCDFGMANAFAELGSRRGSRPYMAPEQYSEEAPLHKADVFATGVILHELLTAGLHPIGVATATVWPLVPSHMPGNWGRDQKWGRWSRSGAKTVDDSLALRDGGLAAIVLSALKPSVAERPTAVVLKSALHSWLLEHDPVEAALLSAELDDLDKKAEDRETRSDPPLAEDLEQYRRWFEQGRLADLDRSAASSEEIDRFIALSTEPRSA
jgi:serine/threonine protein kinase